MLGAVLPPMPPCALPVEIGNAGWPVTRGLVAGAGLPATGECGAGIGDGVCVALDWSDMGATVCCVGATGGTAPTDPGSVVPLVWSDIGATVSCIGIAGVGVSPIDSGSAVV